MKSIDGKSQMAEKSRREKEKERVRRQKIQVREMLGRLRYTVFFQWFHSTYPPPSRHFFNPTIFLSLSSLSNSLAISTLKGAFFRSTYFRKLGGPGHYMKANPNNAYWILFSWNPPPQNNQQDFASTLIPPKKKDPDPENPHWSPSHDGSM